MQEPTTTDVSNDGVAVRVLLVEDEPDVRSTLRYNLKRAGYSVVEAANGKEALEVLARAGSPGIDVVVSDIMMPVMDGYAFAKALRKEQATAELPLMFLTGKGDTADRLEGFRAGADDYLTKPFDIEELLARVRVLSRRALATRRVRQAMAGDNEKQRPSGDLFSKVAEWERRFPHLAVIRKDAIVGTSQRTLMLLREVLMRAPGKDPVLIQGETGTGKTGVAEALHRLGPRADKPFRVVNCAELGSADAAITAGKLFGFGKGSGLANINKDGQPGLLVDVDGGTLFLDEIHRLPQETQAMLLLPIEGRPFHPAVGKGEPRTVDVKFVFATNVDLRAEASAGRFAFDLFQRLAQSQIRVPALRERREDIATLAEHFLDECKVEFDLANGTFARSLVDALVSREYPGNIRELRNLVRELARRAAFEFDTVLTLEHLPDEAEGVLGAAPATPAPTTADDVKRVEPARVEDPSGFWNEVELSELSALRKHRFKIAAAEAELGLSSKSRTLTNHLRGLCFKAIAQHENDLTAAARLIVGRDDQALIDRTIERMMSYLVMVEQHVAEHTVETLYNNLPRDYRRHLDRAVERARHALQASAQGQLARPC